MLYHSWVTGGTPVVCPTRNLLADHPPILLGPMPQGGRGAGVGRASNPLRASGARGKAAGVHCAGLIGCSLFGQIHIAIQTTEQNLKENVKHSSTILILFYKTPNPSINHRIMHRLLTWLLSDFETKNQVPGAKLQTRLKATTTQTRNYLEIGQNMSLAKVFPQILHYQFPSLSR